MNRILEKILRRVVILFSVLVIYVFLCKLLVNSNYDESPFECGFDPKDKSRLPFSLQFFLLVILFLIFDVELVLLMQLPFQLVVGLFKKWVDFFFFVLILLFGVFEEWRRGILNWK